jgi:hypothetical protein
VEGAVYSEPTVITNLLQSLSVSCNKQLCASHWQNDTSLLKLLIFMLTLLVSRVPWSLLFLLQKKHVSFEPRLWEVCTAASLYRRGFRVLPFTVHSAVVNSRDVTVRSLFSFCSAKLQTEL